VTAVTRIVARDGKGAGDLEGGFEIEIGHAISASEINLATRDGMG
jgi:hypothetical protein